jgi:hypothetical protein
MDISRLELIWDHAGDSAGLGNLLGFQTLAHPLPLQQIE